MKPSEQRSTDEAATASAGDLVTLAQERPIEAAERIMAFLRSPTGCPWDREQDFRSIRQHTLEEVYEVFNAIERRAWPELQDELGDLLLQVLFYAQMAAEEGLFDLSDVARSLNAKLIRRHPHLFADVQVTGSADVKRNWEQIKREERSATGEAPASLLDGVLSSMPALIEARKLGSAAARVGFDWPDALGVLSKVREELDELERELRARALSPQQSQRAIEDELGDALFSMVSLARHLRVDPEMALRDANAKFRSRFKGMEQIAAAESKPLDDRTPAELEALWTEVKRQRARDAAAETAPA